MKPTQTQIFGYLSGPMSEPRAKFAICAEDAIVLSNSETNLNADIHPSATLSTFGRDWIVLVLLVAGLGARASSVLPLSLDGQIHASDAVFRGTVLRVELFRSAADGIIYTRTALRVDEGFKGILPPVINVVHRGGTVGRIGLSDGLSPQFRVGEERLLFVMRRGDGTLFATQGEATATRLRREKNGALARGHADLLEQIRQKTRFGQIPGADVTDQTATVSPYGVFLEPAGDIGGPSTNGLLVDAFNVPARFVLPDRGEPIPYLVDATFLPTGISEAQALNAVSNAMSVWSLASTFKFTYAGMQDFGTNADSIDTGDGIFRIQLHDNYNVITSPNILGIGGSWNDSSILANAGWGSGGRVGGTEFNRGVNGFVILKHTNVVMQTLSTFTEVLTHEVGHVLGLAHSSNVVTNDPVLTNSIMYYLAHADGRGAALNSYDTNVVALVHPANTPPWTFNRVIDVTTAASTPNVPGINEVEFHGYDLQSTNLVIATNEQSSINGDFALSGNKIKYTPRSYWADSNRTDPDTSSGSYSYKDIIYSRLSDGTNASPYAIIRVISFRGEGAAPLDGIPDYWRMNFFGHTDPQAGDLSRGTDDPDGDGLNNLQEYIAGMNPKDAASAQRITSFNLSSLQFQAKAYELYEVLGSTNLTTWTRVAAFEPTTASIQVRTNLPQTNITAVISNLPTSGQRMFFRILKVP